MHSVYKHTSRCSLHVADNGCNLRNRKVHVCTVTDPASPVSSALFCRQNDARWKWGACNKWRRIMSHRVSNQLFLLQSWLYLIFGSSRFTDFLWRGHNSLPEECRLPLETPFWLSWKPYPAGESLVAAMTALVGCRRSHQWPPLGKHSTLFDMRDDRNDARNAQTTSNHVSNNDHSNEGVFLKQGVLLALITLVCCMTTTWIQRSFTLNIWMLNYSLLSISTT